MYPFLTFFLQRHYFHYAASDGLIFLCMCDEQFPRRIAFAFLEDIKNRFLSVYKTSYREALPFAMNEEFSRVLQRQMVRVFILVIFCLFGSTHPYQRIPLALEASPSHFCLPLYFNNPPTPIPLVSSPIFITIVGVLFV